ncbi:MAG: hypothetical protein QOE78_705, partial [Alphaproteobacteria bacterium]|nr:hypothetical protein [Alphaproteobacteria bacterium]
VFQRVDDVPRLRADDGDGVLLLQLLHRRFGLAAVTAVDATDVRP